MRPKRLNRPFIPRREFKFWLRTDREGEARLIDFIDYLRKTRQFSTFVKRGLRLLWTLGEGDCSYLFELFPHLAERLNPAPTPPDSGDLREIVRSEMQAGLREIMLELPAAIPAPPNNYPAMKGSSAPAPIVDARPAPVADAATIADDFLNFIQ